MTSPSGSMPLPPPPGSQYQSVPMYAPPKPAVRRSSKPTIAGILLIIVFLMGLIISLSMIIFADDIVNDLLPEVDDGEISGEVIYAGNETAVENALISLEPVDLNRTTDDDGRFEFNGLETGKYTVSVNKSGYKTIKRDVLITESGQVIELEFELEEGSGETETESTDLDFIWTTNIFRSCGVLILVFSLIALAGSINAFRRINYWLALLGSLFGVFTILGTVFSIIAMILLLLSKKSFE